MLFRSLNNLPQTKLVKASSLYLTSPVGYESQPDFINAVAEITTTLDPLALLDAILNIETQAGRERPFANAPRVLDCDLLIYVGVTMQTNKLILPHPRMLTRAFVLLPLAEIAPDLTLEMHGSVVKLSQLVAELTIEGNDSGFGTFEQQPIKSLNIKYQGIKKLG